MHRIFAALPIPDEIADRLFPLKADLYGARWRRREHFHVTLHFYGNVDIEMAEEIASALSSVPAPILDLTLAGVGWFGRKEPRAIYARIAETDALTALAKNCRQIARNLGLKMDAKPFKPHITLAYCKDTPLGVVREWSVQHQMLRSEPFSVGEYHLYESFTGAGRPSRYEAQADYRLGGAN